MSDEVFEKIKNSLLDWDCVSWCERHLTLEGNPYRINGNGYKPLADIARTIAMKALEKGGLPIVICKGRQIGITVLSAAIEMYFMGSGIFGNGHNPPIRVMHCFPLLENAASYSKVKLNSMIANSVIPKSDKPIKGQRPKSYMQTLLDRSSDSNDSLNFKQFSGGNHMFIESVGLDGNRTMGKSTDVAFFDECFPYDQYIETNEGKQKIGALCNLFESKKELPLVKTFNEETEQFEYKKITNAWGRGKKELIRLECGHRKIKCTPNHLFLTANGWVQAGNLIPGIALKINTNFSTNALGWLIVDKITKLSEKEFVYDIEVEDNHNFILAPSRRRSKDLGGPIAHNCQKMPQQAVGNTTKTLTKANYGAKGKGVQVYFGTPLQRGSMFSDMWNESSQQFYHLGCEKCKKHFKFFSQDSNDWEDIWLYGHTVRCTHCGFEQDKDASVERGKWVASKDIGECKYIGFHINQLYMPTFTKESVIEEKPGRSINTEKTYQNEVLGNFWSGETGIISPDEIRELCGDAERKPRAYINSDDGELVFLGIDIGAKNDLEQMVEGSKSQGQSYSTAVVISISSANKITIERAEKFKRNDFASKKETINYFMRKYSCTLTVMDLGFTGDLSEIMQTEYGDRFLSSASSHRVNNHIKFNDQVFPKVITFEKDFWIAEIYEQMRKGNVRFPMGDYEKIAWLIQHCTNMEIKPSISRGGEVTPKYVKSGPNDGFMALLNAYLAYKFHISDGFNIKHPSLMNNGPKRRPPLSVGYIPGL